MKFSFFQNTRVFHQISQQEEIAAYLKLFAVSLIWGSTFIVARFLGQEMPAFLTASMRFILAAFCLCTLIKIRGQKIYHPLTKQQWGALFALSFFGIFLYSFCFFHGLSLVTASRAALITALSPASIALVTCIVDKSTLKTMQLIGITLCVVGACLVILTKDPHALQQGLSAWKGDLIVFGCVISWTIYSIFSRSFVKEIGSLYTVTYSIFLGCPLLIIAGLLHGDFSMQNFSKIGWLEILAFMYLGAMASALSYVWYSEGIQKIGAARSGVFIALNPLISVLLGFFLLGERTTPLVLFGGGVVLLGVVLSNITKKS